MGEQRRTETASTERISASRGLTTCKNKYCGNKDQLSVTGLANDSTKWSEPHPTQTVKHILMQTFPKISNMKFTEF